MAKIAPEKPGAHVVSPVMQAHVTNNPQIMFHPSVLVCQPGMPYDRTADYKSKTMVIHQKTTLVSGSTYKCTTCGESITAA